ncbi:hypothetical protein EON83_22190 [bacterium]|nr:MAG: hypothetical protein EON83_22190 [bacterium]
MNRSFLILPILVLTPLVAANSAPTVTPKPKVVAPAVKAPAAIKPKVVAPPATNAKVPQVKPPRIKPPAGMDDHDHDHGATGTDPNKPIDPVGDSLDFLWKQSDVAFHEGDYPTAVKIHRAIVTLDPTDTESFGVGAWLLWSMEKKSEARDFIDQGLASNPNDAEMWNVAAQQYDLEKSFADAKTAYLKSVELSKGKAPELLRRRLAHSAEHAGDLALSEQTWTDLVREFPASDVDKNNLARVKNLRNKPVE